jgi:hypothetical protein
MDFEYEITPDEFAAAQILYHRARGDGRKQTRSGATWIVTGLLLIVVAWKERIIDWAPVILTLLGAWLIYAGIRHLLPSGYFRRAYRQTELPGKHYKASANENGFRVATDSFSWNVGWQGVRFKDEDPLVFMFCSEGTIFIFGKKYLDINQQQELRALAGLERPVGGTP